MGTEPSPGTACTLEIEPFDRTVVADPGKTLGEICRGEGIPLDSGCGGRGSCGKCIVRVLSGDVDAEPSAAIPASEREKGYVLACRTRVRPGRLRIRVPASSIKERSVFCAAAGTPGCCEPFDPGAFPTHAFFREGPLCTRTRVEMSPPTMDDPVSDCDRLGIALKALPDAPRAFAVGRDVLRTLGPLCRSSGWSVTAWVSRLDDPPEVFHLEPTLESGESYGVAVDIGTTSLSACLCNLSRLRPAAFAKCLNSQAVHGADVITRLIHASRPGGLDTLGRLVIEDIQSLIDALCRAAGIPRESISAVECAGNTTMTQIAQGIDPTFIRKEPYVATANFFPPVRAAELGLSIHPRGRVHFMPCVSSYVGGDITAGAMAVGMGKSEELSLLIDLGTNGELVLGCADWLVCCSCSVGPAFEGSGISSGMLAEPGAIERIAVGKEGVRLTTIGGRKPVGICGSGLIQAFSEFLDAGIIDRAAKFQNDADHPCLRRTEEGTAFVLAEGEDRDVVITQADLDNLLRSKAAVYAAITLTLRKMDLALEDVSRFLVAGAFGNHLDFHDAVRIGMLPDEPLDRYRFVGNTSLTGARAGMGFVAAQEEAAALARKMTTIELSGDNAYHEEFVRACFLPHTDLDLFPSAGKPRPPDLEHPAE
jgi:uncharacterized 2Fe-2S/4Fe-4S cluster protein (DUF4445 family)